MRPKCVSRDWSCLNRSVRICNDENLLPGSWPPPNFLELRKSMKVHRQVLGFPRLGRHSVYLTCLMLDVTASDGA